MRRTAKQLNRYYVAPEWVASDLIELQDPSRIVEGVTEQMAVEGYVEAHLADLDYPTVVQIASLPVDGGTDELSVWEVTIVSVPSATVRKVF